MHRGQFWPISKCCHFTNIRCFLERFLQTRTLIWFTMVFCTFMAFLIFEPNWPFCMGYSPCILANFGHFENAVIFRILGVFCSGFFPTTTCGRTIVFRTFLAFLIVDTNWPFCMGYSPCIVANFGHFQNAVIFRILGVFWSGFLRRTTLMWS